MSDIQHIAAAARGDERFLTAEFERRVRLWSFADRSLVAELDTVLDFGGHRLALCEADGAPVVVAGAWERHGVCAYAADGTRLWQRKDLRQPQHLSPAAGGELLAACFEEGPMHVVRAGSGETVAKVRGIGRFYASRFAGVGLGEGYAEVALVGTDDWKVRWKAPIEGFAILSAAAAPAAFAVGDVVEFDSGGRSSVTCLDLAGDALWNWSAPADTNCAALGWDDDAAEWVGLLNHIDNERPDTLVRWSPDGELLSERPLDLFEDYAFLPGGRHLVTSDGAVRDTRDGSVIWQLPDGGAET